jgi:hypothetical protein
VLLALLTVVALRTYAASLNGSLLTAAVAVAWWAAASLTLERLRGLRRGGRPDRG